MGRIKEWGSYPKKPFNALATKLWNEFFKVADDSVDIAHSRIDAYSATVRLSARKSSYDESDPDLSGLEPSIALVKGITELVRKSTSDPAALEEIRASFRAWAEKGLLEAFLSAQVKRKYEKLNPEGKPFTIVTADTDCGLHEDELTILWSNRRNFTVAQIRSRQAASKKKRKASGKRRGQVLRKKRGVTKKKATAKKFAKKKKSVKKKKTSAKKSVTKKKSAKKKKSATNTKAKVKKKPAKKKRKKKATSKKALVKKTTKKKAGSGRKLAAKRR